MRGRRGGKNREGLGKRSEEGLVENGNSEMKNVGFLLIKTFLLG